MIEHFDHILQKQMAKMNSASVIVRWWDCFLTAMGGAVADRLLVGQHIKLDGPLLYFTFTSCYMRVARQWVVQYREVAPGKGVLMDALKKDGSWVKIASVVRMGPGRSSKATSAYCVDLNKLPNGQDIIYAAEFQTAENTLFESPATPNKKKNDKGPDELPF